MDEWINGWIENKLANRCHSLIIKEDNNKATSQVVQENLPIPVRSSSDKNTPSPSIEDPY